jgi:hypothetical protein
VSYHAVCGELTSAAADSILDLAKAVYAEVAQQCPSVQTHEFAQLRALGLEQLVM